VLRRNCHEAFPQSRTDLWRAGWENRLSRSRGGALHEPNELHEGPCLYLFSTASHSNRRTPGQAPGEAHHVPTAKSIQKHFGLRRKNKKEKQERKNLDGGREIARVP
jgi:hypothetical protein